jgi:hypothetical protein
MFLALNTAFGLPAHALLVHAAVVLVPAASLALILAGLRSEWRRSFSGPLALIAVAAAGFAFLAQQSGGPLRRAIRSAAQASGTRADLGGHPGQGNTALLLALALGAAAVGFWAVGRFEKRFDLPRWLFHASYVFVVIVGLGATATMIIAGHSGATLVWRDVGTYAPNR